MSAGVYCLKHLPSGYFYIGSSMNLAARYDSWCSFVGRAIVGAVKPHVHWRVRMVACETRLSDWWFFVIERMDGASEVDVRRAERRHIWRGLEDPCSLNGPVFSPGSSPSWSVIYRRFDFRCRPLVPVSKDRYWRIGECAFLFGYGRFFARLT